MSRVTVPGRTDRIAEPISPSDPTHALAVGGAPPISTGSPRIGGYEILGMLGRGGMGVVYKARCTRLNREVALKELSSFGASDRWALTRFQAEAEAVARMRHPNIVRVHGSAVAGREVALAAEGHLFRHDYQLIALDHHQRERFRRRFDQKHDPTWNVSADGELDYACSGRTLTVVDFAGGEERLSFRHSDDIGVTVGSPDGSLILVGGRHGPTRLRSAETGKPAGPPMPHPVGVTDATFSPDGRLVLTVCLDRKLRLWDVASGKRVGPAVDHPFDTVRVAFLADSRHFVAAGGDHVLRVWDVP